MSILRILVVFLLWLPLVVYAEDRDCLDGYELTAIVVLENDIRHSVEAFACRMAFPEDSSTYTVYNQLRTKWQKQRLEQTGKRDAVYRRIYGELSQQKIEDWTQSMALAFSQGFTATDIACHDLRNELFANMQDWESVYQSAAREAANEKYDPLRCETVSVIQINN